MKTIEEKNKMIAAFEGYKVDYGFDKKSVLFAGHHIRLNQLRYHESWDWLMPVVDKIEDMRDENNGCLFNVSTIQTWTEIIDCRTSDTIAEGDAETKIQSVFDAVVEFIKWHNSI